MIKISICTVCMNRLHHLRLTLPRNIRENLHYPNLEFVVLNYNSVDGMDEWIRSDMQEYIDAGLLTCYRTDKPAFIDLSHARNMVSKFATGEIICFLDADNFAGPGYVDWIHKIFKTCGDETIITTIRKDLIPVRDLGGKLAISRRLFNAVNGFDESLVGYGMEDVDLVNRLEKAGGHRIFIEDEKFLDYIGHTSMERMENFWLTHDLEEIYLRQSAPEGKNIDVLYFLQDNSVLEVKFEYDQQKKNEWIITYGGWSIKETKRRAGTSGMQGSELLYWRKLEKDSDFYNYLVMGYGECLNRLLYIENEKKAGS